MSWLQMLLTSALDQPVIMVPTPWQQQQARAADSSRQKQQQPHAGQQSRANTSQ
jgi:hypothetical protein